MKDRSRRLSLLTVLAAVALVAVAVLVPSAGAGGAPSIAFNPTSGNYGPIDSGTTASQTFTLTNSGGVATAALKVQLTGSAAFSKTADTCSAVSLGPKKSCSVTVQYAPTTDGASDSGTLTVMSKKPAATASVSLTGSSTAAICSENFSEDAVGSQPTTFAGGTIDTAYGTPEGGVYGPGVGGFSSNSDMSGHGVNAFKLTFTSPVSSVQLNALSNDATIFDTHLTLSGYNASNVLVATQTVFEPQQLFENLTPVPLAIADSGGAIKYFTIATDDVFHGGVFFSDIAWGACAA